MGTSRNSGRTTSLDELLATVGADTLRELVRKLYCGQPAMERECLDFLRRRLPTTSKQGREAASHSIMLLWNEAEPYVSGDKWETDEDRAYCLLVKLAERLRDEPIPKVVRRRILDDGVAYVEHSAFVDTIYDVLYAACYDDDDLRYLAWSLEGLTSEWPLEHARRIYRSLGDRAKYLELRARKMVYGGDYYDLASFCEECGDTDRALAVAKEGLEKGQGRMDELRQFLSQHALRAGDREAYLTLQLQQAVDRITVQSYQDFQRLCTDSEWNHWEPVLMAAAAQARPEERLKLHLLRGEVEQAVRALSSLPYPWYYDDSAVLDAVASLEKPFPDQVLAFYRKGLGDVTCAHQRSEYARKAKVLLKMRRMWTEIMGQPAAWEEFARNIKAANRRRPALQEELGRVIPDWKSL